MAVTPNMGLFITQAGVTPGPAYAAGIDTAWSILDTHNHTGAPNNGVQLTQASLNITGDFSLNGHNLLSVGTLNINTLTAVNLGGNLNIGGNNLTGGGNLTFTTATFSGAVSTGALSPSSIGATTFTGTTNWGTQLLTGTNWGVNNVGGFTMAALTCGGAVTLSGTVNLGTTVAGFTMTGNLTLGTNNISTVGSITGTGTLTFTNANISNLTGNLSIGNNSISGGATSSISVQTLTANGNATVTGTLTQTGVATFAAPPVFNGTGAATAAVSKTYWVADSGTGQLKREVTIRTQFAGIAFAGAAANTVFSVGGLTLTGAQVGGYCLVSVVSNTGGTTLLQPGTIVYAEITAANTVAISFICSYVTTGVVGNVTLNVTYFPD